MHREATKTIRPSKRRNGLKILVNVHLIDTLFHNIVTTLLTILPYKPFKNVFLKLDRSINQQDDLMHRHYSFLPSEVRNIDVRYFW